MRVKRYSSIRFYAIQLLFIQSPNILLHMYLHKNNKQQNFDSMHTQIPPLCYSCIHSQYEKHNVSKLSYIRLHAKIILRLR